MDTQPALAEIVVRNPIKFESHRNFVETLSHHSASDPFLQRVHDQCWLLIQEAIEWHGRQPPEHGLEALPELDLLSFQSQRLAKRISLRDYAEAPQAGREGHQHFARRFIPNKRRAIIAAGSIEFANRLLDALMISAAAAHGDRSPFPVMSLKRPEEGTAIGV